MNAPPFAPQAEPELDPDMALAVEAMRKNAAGKPAYSALTPQEYRVRFVNDRAVNPDKAYVAHVQDISIPVGNGRAVSVRLYSVGKSAEPQPVFVYLHG